MLYKIFTLLGLFFSLCHGKSSIRQQLNESWILREVLYNQEFPARVPGGLYSDLMRLYVIDDIFYSYNDNATKWVGLIDWIYVLNFTVNPEILNYESIELVFEGIDTYARIELNDINIGNASNMFQRYIFDVKDILKENDTNTLRLWFSSNPEVALRLYNEQLEKYDIPPGCPPEAYHGECHINMIRKMQSSFGWDWGPSFPSMGIWRPVYLQAFDDVLVRDFVVRAEDPMDTEDYFFYTDIYFAANKQGILNGTLRVRLNSNPPYSLYKDYKIHEKLNTDGEFVYLVTFLVSIGYVDFWYPHTHGKQPLYDLIINFTSAIDNSITVMSKKTALKNVKLVESTLDEGSSFYLYLNQKPIFLKGTTMLPISILPELGEDEKKIRSLLQSVKDANMNVIRIWGGGLYESDTLYSLADEMGIIIWQDFTFASALYPANNEFLKSISAEVDYNLKRIMHHPSLIIYSANSESEELLSDNWYNTTNNYEQYKSDYISLYITTIKAQFQKLFRGKDLIFLSSSPSNGILTKREDWVGESPNNEHWGDVHYYNYSQDPWDSNNYPIPRFASEYGFQSLPAQETWMLATNNKTDLNISSDFMSWRQHHPNGNIQLPLLISENLKLPNDTNEYYDEAFIYLSQVYSAQAAKVETEHYRRYRSYVTEDGRGYTMGAILKQLNDVWVAPTWSSIDFAGRWKMLHYFAKDFFANIIVSGYITTTRELQIYGVNDNINTDENLGATENVSILIRVYKYNSSDFKPAYENRLNRNLALSSSELIENILIDDFLTNLQCDSKHVFFYFVIQNPTTTENISPVNYIFPEKLKDSELISSNVKISNVTKVEGEENSFEITVGADNIALFVWLDAHDIQGRFSENGFLQVEATRKVYFYNETELTANDLEDALTVVHLTDERWN